MANKCYLTTTDNPYDPAKDFTLWFMFDTEKGYNSCAYLSRIARTSDGLSDEENDLEIERAIDEIIKYDLLGILGLNVNYKKIVVTQ